MDEDFKILLNDYDDDDEFDLEAFENQPLDDDEDDFDDDW